MEAAEEVEEVVGGEEILELEFGGKESDLGAYLLGVVDHAAAVEDGVAAFAVADTVSYLTYTVESSETLGSFSKDKYADKVDGAPGAEITLATDAPSDCRFFRITRVE